MKFYSEKTRQFYSSEEGCITAEKAYDARIQEQKKKEEKLSSERKERANEVSAAFETMLKAQKNYCSLRDKFIHDYGSYHMTYKEPAGEDFQSLLEGLFNLF